MSQRIPVAALVACVTLVVTSPALALDQAQPQRPPSTAKPTAPRGPKPPVFRAWGQFDLTLMTASDTFNAVLGSSTLTGFGGGGELIRLWKGAFARVAFASASGSGSRVIVAGNEAVPLNIATDVSMSTFTIGGGWRHPINRRITAYGGAAFVHLGYSETTDFSANENTDASFSGGAFFGGVEIPLGKWLFAGGEVEWRTIPDAIGSELTSVARAFGETNLGGTTLRVMFGIRK